VTLLSLAAECYRARDFAGARQVLESMIEVDPGDLIAHDNCARACLEMGDYAAAIPHFMELVKDGRPDVQAWVKLGAAALADQQHDLASMALGTAMDLAPDDPVVLHTYASLFATLLLDDAAIALYKRAYKLRPGYTDPMVGHAFCLLRQGKYRRGWELFEKRWDLTNGTREYHGISEWKGERCGMVVLRSEQGFGDTLQFLRYIPLVAERAVEVFVDCHRLMRRIVERIPGVTGVVDTGTTPPAADYQTGLMSLPHIFGTTLENIPPPVRFYVPGAIVQGLPRIGLCWAGGSRPNEPAAHAIDKRRSITFESLAPIMAVPGVEWVSLQREDNRLPGPIDHAADFYDTARLIQSLDAVVTVDTAVCHLAASMGIPTLLLNRFDTCWRWLLEREDSPWYLSLRIFRQRALGEWGLVIERVAAAVREMVGG